jgi:hypothetical protein
LSIHPNVYIDFYLDDGTCDCLFIARDWYYYHLGLIIVSILVVSIHSFFGEERMIYCRKIILTLFFVEYLAYNVVSMGFCYKIDVLTVYLFVWQFISLGHDWLELELLPPVVIIEQSSFCIMGTLHAWFIDLLFLRYLLQELILIGLWLFSLYDM